MAFKITCFGVREHEIDFFHKLNKFNYDLKLEASLLTHKNIHLVDGSDAVLLRANCVADRANLEYMVKKNIKYVFSRTAAYSHIDIDAAKDLGITVAHCPAYSPNAIAELGLTLSLNLLRNVTYTLNKTHKYQFSITPQMFSKEVRNMTVGIIGVGKIGLTQAKLYKGLGSKVVCFDIYPTDEAKELFEFVTQDELLSMSDIVHIYVPFFPNKNKNMINKDFLTKMKTDAILINMSRGELQDNNAIADAIESGKLYGFATDVMPDERDIFFQDFQNKEQVKDESARRLIDLFPKVLITPHIGSNTDEALINMIEMSFINFHEILTTGTTKNLVV